MDVISQEQWDAIRQRFLNDYRHFGDDKEAFRQAMDDMQLLLMAAKPYQLAPTPDNFIMLQGTCMACMMGVCKKDYPHT